MVYFLILLITALTPARSDATQLDLNLGAGDSAYYQKLAPRFLDWILTNVDPLKSQSNSAAAELMKNEVKSLKTWSFNPTGHLLWPRLQFGADFNKGQLTGAFLAIFPENTSSLKKSVRHLIGKNIDTANLIGFGFSSRSGEIDLYTQLPAPPKSLGSHQIEKRVYSSGRLIQTSNLFYRDSNNLPQAAPSFAPLVRDWGIWNKEGKFDAYELEFDRFNLRALDGAASRFADKVNVEFLLANLRIKYRADDDYQILYP